MVRMVVDRLHVSSTPLQVIRYVRSRMRREARTDPTLRLARKQVYRQALEAHRENVDLYRAVVSGQLNAASDA